MREVGNLGVQRRVHGEEAAVYQVERLGRNSCVRAEGVEIE